MLHITRSLSFFFSLGCVLLLPAQLSAQFGTPRQFDAPAEQPLDQERTQRWKAGVQITAEAGPCAGIFGTFAVPVDWPEQDVKVVDEQVSDTVRQVQPRQLEDGVRQMVFAAQRLEYREELNVLMTFEITRRLKPLPLDTAIYQIPKTVPRDVRKFLAPSPYIDCRDSRVRSLSKEIVADHETAWEQVEAICDWVKENVQHTSDPLRGAEAAILEKKGGHEDLAGVFIALCRAAKVPARIVWVPNYCYAEFYLEGTEDEGEWFPCEFKEKTTFGTLSEPYLILQKGENIQVPESKERQRFVAEHLKVKTGSKPKVVFVRQIVGMP